MSKFFDREVRDKLKKADCDFVRAGKGSHEIWYSPHTGVNFAVPIHTKSEWTAKSVLRAAGIDRPAHDMDAAPRRPRAGHGHGTSPAP